MTEWAIDTAIVQLPQTKLEIPAYLAKPKTQGTYPGVIVLQEIFGVNAHIREVTERIAREGYVVIAPALYQRFVPGFEIGYTPEEIEIGRQYKNQTKASELLSDIQVAIKFLKNLDGVKNTGFGCIGFCFGGYVAYLAATLADIKATASFYGAGITSTTPGGGEPIITLTHLFKGTLYAFFGMEDKSIPIEQVEQIESELGKYHLSHRVFRYDGADHGFFCDHRASYNPEAAADAWKKVKQLFEQLQTV